MATYYWVGGAGTWDATTTTNWATSSGGAGSAGVPTSADNVIFDTLSNATAYAVTIGASAVAANCLDLSIAGPAAGNVTITVGATGVINCFGSWLNAATGVAFTTNTGSTINFLATSTGKTITTNGVSVGGLLLVLNSASGGWTLGSAYTSTANINIAQGSFSTSASNYSLTCGGLSSSGTGVRSINLNASTVSLSGTTPIEFTIPTNLTFTAGTSNITVTGTSPDVRGGGQTFYNFSFSAVNLSQCDTSGANTFNNLTFPVRTAAGFAIFTFSADQIVTGTLTAVGSTYNTRTLLASSVIGTPRTITAGAVSLAYVDFRDIVGAGTATYTGTSIGNCLGNSGITFDAPKTVFWNLAGVQVWSAVAWATSSGGTPAAANLPLAQDTAVFDEAGAAGSISLWTFNTGSVDMSARTTTVTFTATTTISVYGNWVNGTGTVITGVGGINFLGRSLQTITPAGITFASAITVTAFGSTVRLLAALTSTNTLVLTSGTLDLNNFKFTTTTLVSTNSNTRSIAFGTGDITVTANGTTVVSMATVVGFTYTGTPTINATYSGSTGTRTYTFGTASALETQVLSLNVTAGSDAFTFANGTRISSINFTGTYSGLATFGSGTFQCYGSLTLNSAMTTSVGTNIGFVSTSATPRTITSANQTLQFSIGFTGVGGTWQLQDALTLGSTRTVTLSAGTFNANNQNVTTGVFTSTTGVRSLSMGSGTWTINGGAASWNTAVVTTLTVTGTAIVSMTSASAQIFAGGGAVWPITLNAGGAGALSITGANTFNNITNTVQPATVTFPASTTTTVQRFSLAGTAGNLVTVNSSTGVAATISKASSLVVCSYLSIQNITATGGATWYAGTTSTNVSGNTGWLFIAPVGYYWVGGAGTWDATTTTNWSTTSGGAGNAGPPTAADAVFFDANSNATAYAVTVSTNAVCNDAFIAGPLAGNVTITSGATAVINCYGSWLNAATGVAFTSTTGSALNFLATSAGKTITTNNVTLGILVTTFNGVGGGWTLGSAITITATFGIVAGTFSTNNFALATGTFNTSGTLTRVITLGASTLTLTGITFINIANPTNLTFNAGTSTIIASNATPTLNGGGLTFYNLSFTNNTSTAVTLTNVPVANNISFTPRTTAGQRFITLSVDLSCNNINWGAPAAVNIRTGFASVIRGTVRTLTIAAPTAVANVDFRDINYASGTMTGTSLGNAGNNFNITFTTAKTVYWNLAAGGSWAISTAWALSSGGAAALANLPLAQDTAIIEDTGLTAGNTITVANGLYMPSIDMSTRTANMTCTIGVSPLTICGDLTFQSSGVLTLTGTGIIIFASPAATQTITSNGVTFTQSLNFSATPGNSVVLNGALTSSLGHTLTVGTLNLAGYTLTGTTFACSATTVKVLAFDTTGKIVITGSGTAVLSGAGSTTANMTVTGTAPLMEFTYAGSTGTRTLNMPILDEANAISINVIGGGVGTGDIVLLSNTGSTYKNITFTNFYGSLGLTNSKVVYGDLVLSAGMTTVAAGQTMTFASTLITQKITTNGVQVNVNVNVQLTVSLQLQDALTIDSPRTFTLTTGTLDMANNTLTCGIFVSLNANVRSVLFGTAQMYLTGNATTIWSATTATNFSYTGTGIVNCTYAGSTGVRIIGHGSTGGTEANTPSFNVTAGTDNVAFNSNTRAKDLDFTGWGAGGVGLLTFNAFNIYGSLTLGPGSVTASLANTVSFIGTAGTQTITSNGVTINQGIVINSTGTTVQLADALSLPDVRSIILTAGTFNANNQNITAGFFQGTTGTEVRSLIMGNGTWTMTGVFATSSANTFTIAATTNLTFDSGQSTLTFTGATAKYFYGGGKTFWKVDQGGAGNLFLYSSSPTASVGNTIRELSNSVSPATIISFAPQVHKISFFTASGTAGNLLVINSLAMSKSFDYVNADYLNIVNSAVSGGAAWYAGANSTDSGGNSGWIFSAAPPFTINASASETATGTDVLTVAPSEFNAGVVNTATGTDTVRPTNTFNVSVVNSATGTVTDSASFLWVPVDDTQNPNWVQINT